MRAQGLHPQTRILDTSYVAAADAQLSGLLAIPAGSRVLRIHRLRLADGEPMSTDTSTCPPAGSPGCAGTWTATRPCTRRWPSAYGVQLAEAVETIETVLADPKDARLLGVDVGMPAAAAVPAGVRRLGRAGRVGPVQVPGRPLQAGHPAPPPRTLMPLHDPPGYWVRQAPKAWRIMGQPG